MAVYRCNKCGHLEEVVVTQAPSEGRLCSKCQAPVNVYDTAFFIRKLVERYISVSRELQAIKQADEAVEAADNGEQPQAEPMDSMDLRQSAALATPEQHEPLKRWFAAAGIAPSFDMAAVDMSGYFDEAALVLGDHYEFLRDLLGRIGWSYRNQYTSLNINVGNLAQKDAQFLNRTCREFYSHALFAKYFYQKQDKVIRLGLQGAKVTRSFFAGGWLEWFALSKVLAEVRQQQTVKLTSCARNVSIRFANDDVHELDVVFLSAKQKPVVIECKSGEFRRDIEKFGMLKKRLGLPDGHFIVLALDIEEAQAASLSSMYRVTFATPQTLAYHVMAVL